MFISKSYTDERNESLHDAFNIDMNLETKCN